MKALQFLIGILIMSTIFNSASAINGTNILAGVALMGVGSAGIESAKSDAQDEADACARRNPGMLCEANSAEVSPFKTFGGIFAILAGFVVTLNGLFFDDERFSDSGFSYTRFNSGAIGVQKEWEF